MAKNKTTESDHSVQDFIARVTPEDKRKDVETIVELFKRETGYDPKMWGPSIIGFGSYHYKYDSGHEGDAPLTGFSPRSTALTFYVSSAFPERDILLAALGKHKTGKGCVYIQKLADVDLKVLGKIIKASFTYSKKVHS